MIEAMVMALFASFVVFPAIVSKNAKTYFIAWKAGNLIALILISIVVFALIVVISFFYLMGDGISLTDAYYKIMNR